MLHVENTTYSGSIFLNLLLFYLGCFHYIYKCIHSLFFVVWKLILKLIIHINFLGQNKNNIYPILLGGLLIDCTTRLSTHL